MTSYEKQLEARVEQLEQQLEEANKLLNVTGRVDWTPVDVAMPIHYHASRYEDGSIAHAWSKDCLVLVLMDYKDCHEYCILIATHDTDDTWKDDEGEVVSNVAMGAPMPVPYAIKEERTNRFE